LLLFPGIFRMWKLNQVRPSQDTLMHAFTLTRDDFAALLKQLNANVTPKESITSGTFALRVALWAALGYTFYCYFKAYDLLTIANPYLSNLAIGAVITFLLTATTSVLNAKRLSTRLLADDGWFLAPQAMRFHEDGIEHESKLGHAQFRWNAFIKHTEDEDRFFLFVEPGQGFVIPKRVLREDNLQELIRTKVPQ